MIVWLFTHTVDYEGVMELQIFSTPEKAKDYAAMYAELQDFEEFITWRSLTTENEEYYYTLRDHNFRIQPYTVDHSLRKLECS